jgi:DNA-binding beta-propeller fold protein YncE
MFVRPGCGRLRSRTARLVAAASIASLVIAGFGNESAHGEPGRSAGPQLIKLAAIPEGVAVDQKTDMIYVELFDGDVAVVDGTTNKVVASISLGDLVPGAIAVDSTRNRIYVLSSTPRFGVSVINGTTNQVVRTIGASKTQESDVAIDPITNRLYVSKPSVSKPGADRLIVFHAGNGKVIKRIVVGKYPLAVAVDPKTDTVYLGHTDSGVPSPEEIIDGKTNKVIQKITTGVDQSLSVDPTTRQVYVADGESPSLVYVLHTTRNGKKTKVTDKIHMGTGTSLTSIAVDSSNHLILVDEGFSQNPSPMNKVAIIDGTTDQIVRTVLVGVDTAEVAVNPKTHIAYACDFHDEALAIIRDA